MSGKQHSYGLDWLDEDALFELTKKTALRGFVWVPGFLNMYR